MQKIVDIIMVVLENSYLNTDVEIHLNTSLREDLGMDSIALAELAVRIESEYDVDVFEDGIVETVREVVEKL